MPSILDRILGRDKKKEEQPTPQRVDEDAARARREQLAAKQAEADAARLRFEGQEKARLAALEEEAKKKLAAAQAEKLAQEDQARLAAMAGARATERIYVVKDDDYLSKIAKEVYGDAHRWPEIYEANKDVIGPNPNIIHGGQKLRIP